MAQIRIIPILLIRNKGLVKSVRFKNHKYVGDPINTVKIFNEKEVDELAVIDIDATKRRSIPDYQKIAEIAEEAFMPLSYGGGIDSLDIAKNVFLRGFEKVIINKALHTSRDLIRNVADLFGSQSVIASIDVKKDWLKRYRVFIDNGTVNTGLDPVEFAVSCQLQGAGEILLNSIDRDGTYTGFDLEIIRRISDSVDIPVIACGGAAEITDFKRAIKEGNASAVAAGSMFVFQRPHNAVLISYPSHGELNLLLNK